MTTTETPKPIPLPKRIEAAIDAATFEAGRQQGRREALLTVLAWINESGAPGEEEQAANATD